MVPGSWSMGELYNYDPASGDARSCGTTASLCGIERAVITHDRPLYERSIQRDLLMHHAMGFLRGFPMLNCGDEIGQLNGWDYKEDPDRVADSRNLHRSKFSWKNAAKRDVPGTLPNRLWEGMADVRQMRSDPCFAPDAWVTTWDAHDDGVLAMVRQAVRRTLLGVFNFANRDATATLDSIEGVSLPRTVALKPYEWKIEVC